MFTEGGQDQRGKTAQIKLMSSSSSSSSEYMPGPVLAYPPVRTPFEKPGRSSFRIITPASQQNKRKRDLLDSDSRFNQAHTHTHSTGNDGTPNGQAQRYAEMSQFRVVAHEPLVVESPGSAFGPTGKLKAKPPKPYPTATALLAALRTTCIEDPEVDFSGSYVVAADAVSDKERVQMVSNDVWRATGYRFTVKDHPKCERGHKTRMWCSQDEARRSKTRNPNDAPRLSKQGELFAKQRYPCRSRLMITCVPEADAANNAHAHRVGAGGGEVGSRGGGDTGEGSSGSSESSQGVKVVTIRMHHYMRHEAYVEAVAAAEGSRTQSQPPQAPPPSMTPASAFMSAVTAPLPAHLLAGMMRMPPPPPPPLDEGEGEWDLGHPHPHSHHQHRQEQQESEPEPEMSPSPSPHFSPQAQARFAPPPPPQDIVVDTQLHQPPPPPPPQITMTTPYQHRTTPPTPMTMQQQQPSPPTHAQQHSPASQMPPPPPPTHQQPRSHAQQQPQQPHSHAQQPVSPPLTPAEFQRRMRAHITRIRDFCDGLEYQLQFNDYRMLEALERDAAPFLGMVGDCLGLEGK